MGSAVVGPPHAEEMDICVEEAIAIQVSVIVAATGAVGHLPWSQQIFVRTNLGDVGLRRDAATGKRPAAATARGAAVGKGYRAIFLGPRGEDGGIGIAMGSILVQDQEAVFLTLAEANRGIERERPFVDDTVISDHGSLANLGQGPIEVPIRSCGCLFFY